MCPELAGGRGNRRIDVTRLMRRGWARVRAIWRGVGDGASRDRWVLSGTRCVRLGPGRRLAICRLLRDAIHDAVRGRCVWSPRAGRLMGIHDVDRTGGPTWRRRHAWEQRMGNFGQLVCGVCRRLWPGRPRLRSGGGGRSARVSSRARWTAAPRRVCWAGRRTTFQLPAATGSRIGLPIGAAWWPASKGGVARGPDGEVPRVACACR